MPGMIIFWLFFISIDECMNQITYPDRKVMQPAGRTGRIKCSVDTSTLQENAIHMYRTKAAGGLERILHFGIGDTKGKNDAAFDRRFTGSITRGVVTLAISPLRTDDAGMYYCALWSSDNHSVNRERTSLQKPVDISKKQLCLKRRLLTNIIVGCNY